MIELKPFFNNTQELLEKYKLVYYVEEEDRKTEKYNKWDSGIITKYVVAERFGNKYLFKDYADYQYSIEIPSEVF